LPTAGEEVSFDDLLSSADGDARKALELAAAFNAHRAQAISVSLQQIDDASFPEQAKVSSVAPRRVLLDFETRTP
jgi:hypothetical protein